MVMTQFAAPQMLSLRTIGDDPAVLQRAFDNFDRLGSIRGVFQILSFGANLWSLIAIVK